MAKAKRFQRFPNTLISCARFKGTSKATFIDKLDLETDILTAIDEIPKFIQRHTLNHVVFKGMVREEIPEYPPLMIREILINAFVHANYEVLGSRFTIAIFDDRLEIQNPGILMPGMTLEYLKAGISRIRNSVLARVFLELGLVEAWGSCYERIRDICSAANCPEPTWEELGSILRVTLRPSDHDPIMIQKVDHEINLLEKNEIQERILSLLETHESMSLKELASYISPIASLRTLRYELSKLKELGLIDTEGHARGAKWKRVNLNK